MEGDQPVFGAKLVREAVTDHSPMLRLTDDDTLYNKESRYLWKTSVLGHVLKDYTHTNQLKTYEEPTIERTVLFREHRRKLPFQSIRIIKHVRMHEPHVCSV